MRGIIEYGKFLLWDRIWVEILLRHPGKTLIGICILAAASVFDISQKGVPFSWQLIIGGIAIVLIFYLLLIFLHKTRDTVIISIFASLVVYFSIGTIVWFWYASIFWGFMMPELKDKCEVTKEQYYQTWDRAFEKLKIQDYKISSFENIPEEELKVLRLKEELNENCKMF